MSRRPAETMKASMKMHENERIIDKLQMQQYYQRISDRLKQWTEIEAVARGVSVGFDRLIIWDVGEARRCYANTHLDHINCCDQPVQFSPSYDSYKWLAVAKSYTNLSCSFYVCVHLIHSII